LKLTRLLPTSDPGLAKLAERGVEGLLRHHALNAVGADDGAERRLTFSHFCS
jgi:hypothetical protein